MHVCLHHTNISIVEKIFNSEVFLKQLYTITCSVYKTLLTETLPLYGNYFHMIHTYAKIPYETNNAKGKKDYIFQQHIYYVYI